MIVSLDITPGFDASLHEVVRLFYPDCEVVYDADEPDLRIGISVLGQEKQVWVKARLQGHLDGYEENQFSGDDIAETKREIRCSLLRLLMRANGTDPSPYGILTGIRPTKLIHKMFDRGLSEKEAVREISEKYLVNPEQAQLLAMVASNNRVYLPNPAVAGRSISVYVGIPYCPSRCSYCSFPGYPLSYKPGLEQYFEALLWEMGSIGEFLHQEGFSVENIYIGGGTPTVLNAKQWLRLLPIIERYYLGPGTREFTVEAGRPETIESEVLHILREARVNRLCINPQTMNETTLDLIGRRHTVEAVGEAVTLARSAGFININMDLIVGLPGEGTEMFLDSLDNVLALAPEGITIHTLARKRGSRLDMDGMAAAAEDGESARQAVQIGLERLTGKGYFPYYLYRQKHMTGNLENIGYARPGYYGLYNIQIIEERQTVIGLGSGSSSKFVNGGDWSLTSMYHPKDPLAYVNNVKTLVARQVDKLKALS
ncbi:MAG: coproporphyrinogen dehydrogenase HemZ [Ignavibacteriales bacterium]